MLRFEYLTNQKTTPRDLAKASSAYMHSSLGEDDMALFGDYMEQACSLSQSEIYY